jgi:hypothetical protein
MTPQAAAERSAPAAWDRNAEMQVLLKELELARTRVAGIIDGCDRSLAVAAALLSGVVVVGARANLTLVFFLVPLVLVGLFAILLTMNHIAMLLGGYANLIEDRINALAGRPLVNWIGWGTARHLHRGRTTGFMYLALGLFHACVSLYCLSKVHGLLTGPGVALFGVRAQGGGYFWAYCLLVAALTVAALGVARGVAAAQGRFYEELRAREAAERAPSGQADGR